MTTMDIWELPNGVNVEGINLNKDWFTCLVREGSNIDRFPLDRNADTLVASYQRTGKSILTFARIY